MDIDKLKAVMVGKIQANGYQAYIQIPDEDKSLLYALCVNVAEFDWIYDSELVPLIAKFVVTDTGIDALVLAKQIKKSLVDYYDTRIEDLFDECLSIAREDAYRDSGLRPTTDPINGEITWTQ